MLVFTMYRLLCGMKQVGFRDSDKDIISAIIKHFKTLTQNILFMRFHTPDNAILAAQLMISEHKALRRVTN